MIDYLAEKMKERGWLYVTVHDSAIIHKAVIPEFNKYVKEYFEPYGVIPNFDHE